MAYSVFNVRLSVAILLWILTSMIPATSGETASPQSPPNVVFILAEDFGWGDLACYGHPYARTPNIDKLADEGTRFMNFHVTGVTCAPSRTGFMTSRHPASFPNYMPDWTFQGVPTVTELLKGAGYNTGHIGKWHMGHDNEPPAGTYGIDFIDNVGPSNGHAGGKDFDVFSDAIGFIENNAGDTPFYLNIWTHIAHSPVEPHSSLVDLFSDVVVDRSNFGKHHQSIIDEALEYGGDLNTNMRHYLADVWSLDQQTGRLLQILDDLRIRENTIVVFTADQGAAPPLNGQSNPQNMLGYAGGLRGGKHDLYEGGVRTSFIVRWPGHVPAGKVNEKSLVSGLDWLPTLCKIAGAPIDKSMFEGEDVSDIWKGSTRQRTNPVFYKTSNEKGPKAILYDKWKFHDSKDTGKVLYDLETNPEEDINVLNIYPDVAAAMEDQLTLWDSTLPAEYCLKKRDCNEKLSFDPTAQPEIIGPPPLLTAVPAPTGPPTPLPTTRMATDAPAEAPTNKPTDEPTEAPTDEPTDVPTETPTDEPTDAPTTDAPTEVPTEEPTNAPTLSPTDAPTDTPTDPPTELPTDRPTESPVTPPPTVSPTDRSTNQPTAGPILSPSSPTATSANSAKSAAPGIVDATFSCVFCVGLLLCVRLIY